MRESSLFHALAWCMMMDLRPKTRSHALLHGAGMLYLSQDPNSWSREKCSKKPMSALSWPPKLTFTLMSLCQVRLIILHGFPPEFLLNPL